MNSIEIKHLSDLKPLQKNARRRTPRSAGMIVESLHEVGAARSGVVDENFTILAGNGTAEALAEAGIEKVKVVEADGNEWVVVKRTGLSDEQKRKLALYDNRTAELADWDLEVLLNEAKEIDLSAMWSKSELDAMVADDLDALIAGSVTGEESGASSRLVFSDEESGASQGERFRVVVTGPKENYEETLQELKGVCKKIDGVAIIQ